MKIARSLKATLTASVCLVSLQAYAQTYGSPTGEKPASEAGAQPASPNWIMLGGQYNSNRSYYLGRFSGTVDPGFYGLGAFHYGQRDPWDSGGTNYFEMDGADLGLSSRSFEAKMGQQGTWGLGFSYDGIPYNASNNFQSVWTKYGTTVPGVPPGSLSANYPPSALILPGVGSVNSLWLMQATNSPAGKLYNYNIGTQRDVFKGTGKWQWNDWTITGAFRHEHKSGYQANSLVIGAAPSVTTVGTGGSRNVAPTTGITSGLGYFAMPIDYDTERYDITAAYGNPRFQAQVGYTFSVFTDNMTGFNAQNPFNFTNTATYGAPNASLTAPLVGPPSNSAHQVRIMLGYNVTPTMRINANFAAGLQMQNAAFQPATGDPANVPSRALPRSSFDGLVRTLYGNVAMTAEPLPKMDVRLAYTIDNRDNQSPRNAYAVFQRSDNAGASGAIFSNLPFSYDHQTIVAEAGYRIFPQTKVTLNDTFETTYRNYTAASFVTQNTVTAKVRSQLLDTVFGSLSYSHQDRDAHNYNTNLWWTLVGEAAAEPRGLVIYFEASRKHDDVKATVDLSPLNNLTATLLVKFSDDRYPDTTYGLRNNHNIVVGPDVFWQATPTLSAHAFYTFQQLYYEQSSLYASSSTPPLNATTGFSVPWTAKSTDSVHTFGINVDWEAIKDVLKFTLDYNFAYGDTAYALGDSVIFLGSGITSPTGPGVNAVLKQLPDVTSMLNMIQIRGEYTFQPNMTLIFGYAFERFSYKDFMVGTSATAFANALLPGTMNPNDSVHVVGAGMRIRF